KAIIGKRDVISRHQKSGLDHILDRDTLLSKVFFESKAIIRCVAEAKFQLHSRIDAAIGKIAARPGTRSRGERRLEEFSRQLDNLVERITKLAASFIVGRELGQRHAGLSGKPL